MAFWSLYQHLGAITKGRRVHGDTSDLREHTKSMVIAVPCWEWTQCLSPLQGKAEAPDAAHWVVLVQCS